MHLYTFLVYCSFAFIVRAGVPRKSTRESFWNIKTNKIMTWNTTIYLLRVNIPVLRQLKQLRSVKITSYLHVVIMREFTSLQNSAPDKNSLFWVVSEHLTLSITQIHTSAFAKYVSQISDRAPWFPWALSGRLPRLLVKSAPALTVPIWWNDLPNSSRAAESLANFKKRLKTHLFHLYLTL